MLRLYWRLVWARERSAMQYRLSFALLTLASGLYMLIDVAAIAAFFVHVPHFAGWSLPELLLLYSLGGLAFATAEVFATGFDELPRQIRQGTFDRVLVRPHGAFFQTFAAGLSLRRIARIVQSAALLVAGAWLLELTSARQIAVLLLALVAGAVIYFSIFVGGAAYSFWTVQGTEVINIFTNGGQFATSYPLDAYQGWLRRTLTFVLPLAFINYYPVLHVLGRPAPLGLPDWVGLASPLVAALFALAAWRAWTAGVRRYLSTGS